MKRLNVFVFCNSLVSNGLTEANPLAYNICTSACIPMELYYSMANREGPENLVE